MKIFRPLLAGLLLFAFALPVAAVDETPAPAPEAVLYSATDPVPCSDEIAAAVAAGNGLGAVAEACLLPDGTLVPINVMTLGTPADSGSVEPCSPEVAAAAGTENQIIADAPCLLPDGSLYALAVRSTVGGDGIDHSGDYAAWMEEFKANLEPCPEGTDPADMNVVTCLLPDGTIVGPVPMFSAAGGVADDVSGASDGDADNGSTGLLLFGGIAAAGAALVFALRRRQAA